MPDINNYVPMKIVQNINNSAGDIIRSIRWNELWNLVITQGDYNSDTLVLVTDELIRLDSEKVSQVYVDTADEVLQTQINNTTTRIDNHVAGSEKHNALDVNYSGVVPEQSNVEGAIDAVYTRVDGIILASVDVVIIDEVVNARSSAIKATVFPNLDARFEDVEAETKLHIESILPHFAYDYKINYTYDLDGDIEEAEYVKAGVKRRVDTITYDIDKNIEKVAVTEYDLDGVTVVKTYDDVLTYDVDNNIESVERSEVE